MIQGLLGRKIGMTQIFTDEGVCLPVTIVQAGPVKVVQVKTKETDGYAAVQVGFQEETKRKRVTKPALGHFRQLPPFRHLREFKLQDEHAAPPSIGQAIDLSVFSEGEVIWVSANSKGRGFQGVIKRYGFSGGPAAHGSQFHRSPGSIGNRTDPGRVFKGKKLPGRMGARRITTKNLKIAKIAPEKGLILIHGPVPGPNGAVVEVRKPTA